MTDSKWERLQALFEEARDLAPKERAAFLEETCEDPALRELVSEMLVASESDALGVESKFLVSDPSEKQGPEDPHAIAGYRLVRQLGRGGMADVFLAEADGTSGTDPVAIKVLRHTRASPDMVRRFEAEAGYLGRLAHPNIARFRGAGVTSGGLPYLAMTYVDGEPLLDYVEQARPSLGALLALFRTVCSAVHYAHGEGVIHRDLKPSNVLVRQDAEPVLLDFGIGKLMSVSPDESPLHIVTPPGVRLLTPSHAAPEQVKGEPPSVQTDVYGLGLLLYELVTGEAAFPTRGVNWFEWERRVLEESPPLPSSVARSQTAEGQERLRTELTGELDAIVMKALEKDPAARFDSAEAFSERIHAYMHPLGA